MQPSDKRKSKATFQQTLRTLAELCLSLKYQAEFKGFRTKKTKLLRDYSFRVSTKTVIMHKLTHLFIFIGTVTRFLII